MRRGERGPGRRPAAEDLDSRQLAIYQALPASLQTEFLEMLPPIRPSATDQKKAEQIRARARLFSQAAARFRDQAEALNSLAARVEKGARVDLRLALEPPAIPSLAVRITRQREAGAPAEPQRRAAPEPQEEAAPAAAPDAKPSRVGRKRQPAREPGADTDAPYGRDPAGNPYMPWGATGKGVPARPGGRFGAREVEKFLAIVRENPNLSDAGATAEYQRRKAR